MPKTENGLTIRQEKFITEYIKTGNATKSAVKAGYSKNSAYSIGCELLNNPKVKEEIENRLEKKRKRDFMSEEEILKILTKFARGKVKEEQIVVEGCGEGISTARIVEKKISNRDQLAALDKYIKIFGMYRDKDDSYEENSSTKNSILADLSEQFNIRTKEFETVSEDIDYFDDEKVAEFA